MGRERSNWKENSGKGRNRSAAPSGRNGKPSNDKRTERGTKSQRGGARPIKTDDASENKGYTKPTYKGRPGLNQERRKKGDNLPKFSEEMRLNKFLSNAGVCGRRAADVLIGTGSVSVNDVPVTGLGIKVNPEKDVVKVDGNTVGLEQKHYFVLNKPKDFIPIMGDPYSRKTVSMLMKGACKEAIYPVDKVDKMTSGVLLFCNDGDLIIKLSHPKFKSKKIYHVTLNRKFSETEISTLREGVELEGNFFKPESVEYVGKGEDKTQLGIEVLSNKNSIIKRCFDHFGCKVVALDRVLYSGITKKDLKRGTYRRLTPQEVINLKNMRSAI